MAKLLLRSYRWRKRIRRFVQSKHGKLACVISLMFVVFGATSALEQFSTPNHVWQFSCHADSYFADFQPLTEPDELMLIVNIEHEQAQLHYQLQSGASLSEYAVMQGAVRQVDLGSSSYLLALNVKTLQWQEGSALHPYLLNELTFASPELKLNDDVSIELQILNIDREHSRAMLTFNPSNSLWSCKIIPAVMPQPH